MENSSPILLSLIALCMNEAENVAAFQAEALREFGDISFEIVFVDDGSKDGTLDRLRQLYQENACPVQVISFSRNFGKEAAMLAGMRAAKGELLAIVDADLQQPLSVVKEMVRLLQDNSLCDCVAAYQEHRNESSLQRGLKSSFYRVINRFSEVDFVANASDFRTFRRPVAEALLSMAESHRFSKGLFSWVGFPTQYIPYTARSREHGQTKWSLPKLFRYAWEGILSFSTIPIKMAIYLGLICAALSMAYLLVVLVQKLAFSIDVPGYATIVCLVLFLGGLQLFFLGILGEYIGRIYIQVKRRPPYIVREHLYRDSQKEASSQDVER